MPGGGKALVLTRSVTAFSGADPSGLPDYFLNLPFATKEVNAVGSYDKEKLVDTVGTVGSSRTCKGSRRRGRDIFRVKAGMTNRGTSIDLDPRIGTTRGGTDQGRGDELMARRGGARRNPDRLGRSGQEDGPRRGKTPKSIRVNPGQPQQAWDEEGNTEEGERKERGMPHGAQEVNRAARGHPRPPGSTGERESECS